MLDAEIISKTIASNFTEKEFFRTVKSTDRKTLFSLR
jgi:hypothetical protein